MQKELQETEEGFSSASSSSENVWPMGRLLFKDTWFPINIIDKQQGEEGRKEQGEEQLSKSKWWWIGHDAKGIMDCSQ